MDIFETAVLDYCVAQPGRFVSPQFYIAFDHGTGGSQPDFVVLDFPARTVYVIEVTSASDSSAIMSRVTERESRWLKPLRGRLPQFHKQFADWRFHVTLFLRSEICEKVRAKVKDMSDVSIISLDDAMFSWRWEWHGEEPKNPLEAIER